MAKAVTQKRTVKNPQQKTSSKKLTAKQIVHRHMRDKNDVITDDDLKNVHIDPNLPHDKAHQPLPIINEEERPKDEDKDPKMITPWNVLNE